MRKGQADTQRASDEKDKEKKNGSMGQYDKKNSYLQASERSNNERKRGEKRKEKKGKKKEREKVVFSLFRKRAEGESRNKGVQNTP